VIVPGVGGTLLIVIDLEEAVPLPQLFFGVTVTLPPELPNVTVMVLVFCPEVMVAPEGTVHV
jgi:hypothetical protein